MAFAFNLPTFQLPRHLARAALTPLSACGLMGGGRFDCRLPLSILTSKTRAPGVRAIKSPG